MSTSARWAWIVAIVAATGAALVLAFVVSFSAQGGGFYERHFVWLFWVNVAVAVLLTVVIGVVALRLAVRVQRGKFGSRLLIKLAGIFALVGLLPGLVIYTVSYQFASRSIAAWFDVKVAGALDAGLALGRGTLDTLTGDLVGKARVGAERLADAGTAVAPLALERLREQLGAAEASLVSGNGQVLFAAGGTADAGPPERPSAHLLRLAKAEGAASVVEGLDDEALAPGSAGPRVRALARVPRSSISLAGSAERYLMIVQPMPRALATNALAVQAAYSEYQQRFLARESLRRMYVGMAHECTLDSQGRVLVAPELRRDTALDGDAVWSGASRYVELWSKSTYEKHMASLRQQLDAGVMEDALAKLAELGL